MNLIEGCCLVLYTAAVCKRVGFGRAFRVHCSSELGEMREGMISCTLLQRADQTA